MTEAVRTHRGLSLVRQSVPDLETLDHSFEDHYTNMGDLSVMLTEDYRGDKSAGSRPNLLATKIVMPDGRGVATSNRFWTSLAAKAGFSPNIFSLFTHEEVFNRIKDRGKLDGVRIVEHHDKVDSELLSISDPEKGFCRYDEMLNLLRQRGGTNLRYADGIIMADHELPNGHILDVAGEDHKPRLMVEVPIDGYGNTNVFIGLLRLICINGAVALAKAFKTQVKQQKNDESMSDALHRMFDSYSNDEGFDALIQRMNVARQSVLSVEEALKIYKKLIPMLSIFTDNAERTKDSIAAADTIRGSFMKLIGDLQNKYGQSNLDSMTVRQRKSLPCDCRVYDMFQFLTEMTSHTLTRGREQDALYARNIHGLIGTMLTNEYDFEGILPAEMGITSADPVPDFFFSVN